MASLLDIAPVADSVVIRGDTYPVRGLSVGAIAALLMRFPALQSALGGGMSFGEIAAVSEDAVCAILASALGHAGEAEYEAAVANLTADEQADVFAKVLRLTMPGGVVPFVSALEKIMAAVAPPPGPSGKALSTKSQS